MDVGRWPTPEAPHPLRGRVALVCFDSEGAECKRNSNVISLPRGLERLGYTSGTSVVVDELESGELRVVPASRVHELIRETGRRVVAENREALEILERDDRRQAPAAARSRRRAR